jgi:hypothetical protein
MKTFKSHAACALVAGALTFVVGCKSDGHGSAATASVGVQPYPLKKCIVTDEELEPRKEYTFIRDGREIKLCCKDCLADFDKDPKKFMAKLSGSK